MTKRAWPLLAALFVLAFVVGAYARAAASESRILLPAVFQSPAASICDGSPLSSTDVGALSAMRDADGEYIIAIQDRYDGSQAHVMRHVDHHLEELAAPALAFVRPVSPPFSPPGVKQGALALVPNAAQGQKSRLYYTERDAGDTSGPYKVRCLEF